MREYSNAFKENYHYDKFIEIFNSGVIYYGQHEMEFVKKIRSNYGLNIVMSDFGINHDHFSMRVYLDFEDTNHLGNILKEDINKYYDVGWPLDDIHYSSEVREFSQILAEEYLQTFNYNKDCFLEKHVYAHDFYRCVINRLYAISLYEIRSFFRDKYRNIKFWRIITWHEPSITCIVDDKDDYKKLLNFKKTIIEECFKILKGHDKFDLLKKVDVNILFLLKSTLDDKTLNIYTREVL